jgi:hypothetical protein
LYRRVGRVVDCGGLENRCTERYRGFESLTLRTKAVIKSLLFFVLKHGSIKSRKDQYFNHGSNPKVVGSEKLCINIC